MTSCSKVDFKIVKKKYIKVTATNKAKEIMAENIIDKFDECGIILMDSNSTILDPQLIDDEYAREKIVEVFENE